MNCKKEIITIKIGSSVLLTDRNKLDEFRIARIASQIGRLRDRNYGVILVVSGAVACGSKFTDIRQAAAGVGQVLLISTFHLIFKTQALSIAQILLTQKDLSLLSRRGKIIQIINFYVNVGIVPVINENDVVDLNSFAGNDFLSVEVAKIMGCKKLLIMSTMKGSEFGIGGGEAKQKAVELAGRYGIDARIINGKLKNVLLEIL